MNDLTPSQQAAAFHGLAINSAMPLQERLSFALTSLDMYEAEVERLRAERDQAYGQGRDDEAGGLPLRYEAGGLAAGAPEEPPDALDQELMDPEVYYLGPDPSPVARAAVEAVAEWARSGAPEETT